MRIRRRLGENRPGTDTRSGTPLAENRLVQRSVGRGGEASARLLFLVNDGPSHQPPRSPTARARCRSAPARDTLQAAEIAGIRAVLVHAISEDAKRFYERCGFQPSPVAPMTLMITLRDAAKALTENE